jgi:hypothetical protein
VTRASIQRGFQHHIRKTRAVLGTTKPMLWSLQTMEILQRWLRGESGQVRAADIAADRSERLQSAHHVDPRPEMRRSERTAAFAGRCNRDAAHSSGVSLPFASVAGRSASPGAPGSSGSAGHGGIWQCHGKQVDAAPPRSPLVPFSDILAVYSIPGPASTRRAESCYMRSTHRVRRIYQQRPYGPVLGMATGPISSLFPISAPYMTCDAPQLVR